MVWILNELSWTFILFVFSLVSVASFGYFKFSNSFETSKIADYLNLFNLVKKLNSKLTVNYTTKTDSNNQLNSDNTNNKKYSTFKTMTSLERKQSFIKHSLEERNRKHQKTDQQHESFIYSTICSFTKNLINRAPKSIINNAKKNNQTSELTAELSKSPPNISNQIFQISNNPQITSNNTQITKLPLHPIMSTMNTMTALNENLEKLPKNNLSKSVSLQIRDEMKAPIPKNRLLHQSSSSTSSNSSTPADLFSLAEKGRSLNLRKHKPLVNNKVYQQQPTFTELVTQIQNHEDAINREYLLHQLNPSQYHSMHYYRRLERQNCLNSNKKLNKQDTVQSNSSNQENNSNELGHFTSSSSNLSCSECGSLDTEEELTLPFMKKSGHYNQPNVTLRSKQPLKLSSLERNCKNTASINHLTKQCSSDSNEAIVGLLNENLIKRQLSNKTYLKLSDRLNDKLKDKRKRILGRRFGSTAQNSFSAGSSFNNSSNNSSFDHDDMLVQFAGHHPNNSFSGSEANNQFLYNHYENNSIHSNDDTSSSNSSCGNVHHAERTKILNMNEFKHSLNICDSHHLTNNQINEQDEEHDLSPENDLAVSVTHAYDPTTRKLKIRIIKGEYMPMKQFQDCDRCYVTLNLLPNKRHKFKTTIKSCNKSNSIEFDELFVFNRISPENIMGLSIKYMLFLMNKESKHHKIGEAIIRFQNRKPMQQEDHLIVYLNPLAIETDPNQSFDLKLKNNVIKSIKNSNSNSNQKLTTANNESLSDVSSGNESVESHHSIQLNHPELFLGLAYNAITGRLQVSIIRGSQFKAKSTKPPDTFVKCTLLSSAGREIGRNKTSVKKSQPNPVYKQTFAFQVALFQLPDVSLMISVYNKKSMNRKEMIGWFSLGCNSSGEEENSHWVEMRDSKGEQICRWHMLQI